MTASISQADASRSPPARVSGILVFIIADIIVFGILFLGFMSDRLAQLELFDSSAATLNVNLGMLNTVILMTSGLLVVLAVNAARHGNRSATRWWLGLSMLVGLGFGVTKLTEYSDKFDHGLSMMTNNFYMYYFVLTGAHFLHFLGGMVALAALWFLAGRNQVNGPYFRWLESGALYWHMVDLLWIVIFPMLYLLGPR
ncbi:MAG TPA: cytochrome c oxidase subunit 3 [Macromonas sp.]|nr:cytochrome c oxidase subunit 3 [Macromonas sp.]